MHRILSSLLCANWAPQHNQKNKRTFCLSRDMKSPRASSREKRSIDHVQDSGENSLDSCIDSAHGLGSLEWKIRVHIWSQGGASIMNSAVLAFFHLYWLRRIFSFSLNLWLVIQRIDSYRNKSNIIKWNVAEATESQLHSFFFLERGFGRLFIVRMIKRMGLDSTRLDSALILRTFT